VRARQEVHRRREALKRLRTQHQRLRERLERVEEARRLAEDAYRDAEQEIDQLGEEKETLLEQLSHLRERRRQEKMQQRKHGQAPAILAVLPVLDHLQMATQHASADPQKILQGVEMVVAQFRSALHHLGVQRVPASRNAEFLPEIHEAMMHIPTADVPTGQIVEEIASGYTLNGRLLRAARVSVAAPLHPQSAEESSTPEPATEQRDEE